MYYHFVFDFCSRRQWVREEDLAKDLKIHTKQLRRMLRFFEEEKLITRDHRKEVYSACSALWPIFVVFLYQYFLIILLTLPRVISL